MPHDPTTRNSLPLAFTKALCTIVTIQLLTGCAQQAATGVSDDAPGFFAGLWHGFIFPLAWFLSLFLDSVAIYAVPNNGGWYDFGYFIGIVFLGVGARKTRQVVVRERIWVKQ